MSAPAGIFVHYSRARQDWETPPELFAQLHAEFGFTLDVCADAANAKCVCYFSEEHNGLAQDWGYDVCWMNPPYGAAVAHWIAKAGSAARAGATVVCLVPARTDTAWWHDHVQGHAEVRFLRGRVPFVRSDGQRSRAPFPSAIVIYRPHPHDLGPCAS